MLKRLILGLFIAFTVIFTSLTVLSQPGNNNPVFTNPYTNPYQNNPFGVTNDKNDKNDNKKKDNKNNSNSKDKDKDKNKNTNPNNLNSQYNNTLLNTIDNQGEGEIEELNDTKKTELKDSTLFQFDKKMKPSLIYGMDFFNNNNFKIDNNDNVVAPPSNYELGPGDEIIVSVWGQSQIQKRYIIAKDGSIYTEFLGKIYLQGLSYESAKLVIRNKFKTILAPNSTVDVQIGKVRTIRVRITGEVNVPGVYTMSSFNSAINALSYVGGIKETGSLRNIKIIRGGQIIHTIDMYRFLKDGGNEEDVFLEDNDIINIELNTKLVKAEGAFKRPMYYQLKEEETLNHLLKWSGGASYDGRTSLIQIKTVMDEESKLLDVNLKELEKNNDTYILLDGDVVIINKVNEDISNTVEIKGAVKYPSNYELVKGQKLMDIIDKAGGLTGDAYLYRAFIYRNNEKINGEAINVNLTEIKRNDPNTNITLETGDMIIIKSKSAFKEKFKINVNGEVRSPGEYEYYSNLTLKDLLIMSGGVKLSAESGRIEISNIVDSANNYDITLNKNKFKTIKINPDLSIDEESEKIIIKPYDRVYVRTKSNFKLQEKIFAYGQFKYPGEYVKIKNDETVSSLVERAGGLSPTAYVGGAQLYRENIGMIVIDLERALSQKGSKYDLILSENDSLIIPSKIDVVETKGQVQKPIHIKFENNMTHVKDYINASGGFAEQPWKDRISVIYANGKSKTTKRIFFIRKYPKVKEGSLVYVPLKPENKNKVEVKDIFSGAASIVSILATTVLIYNSLK